MGLDNGFIVKNVNIEECPLNFLKDRLTTEKGYDPELIYWRKHWGLRNDIIDLLHASTDDAYIKVDIEDIPAIVRTIIKYMNEDFWNEHSQSIWLFDEAMNWLPYDVIALCWLEEYWKVHPEVEVCFYDSY